MIITGMLLIRTTSISPYEHDTFVNLYNYENGKLKSINAENDNDNSKLTEVKWINDTAYFIITKRENGSILSENKTTLNNNYYSIKSELVMYDDEGKISYHNTNEYVYRSDKVEISINNLPIANAEARLQYL